jgi:alkanesulfonate monooxygenase SsuD/methylene tetrahydromethanopterin reductase-like flavin-dependent oxidoreductase (luciferase family)
MNVGIGLPSLIRGVRGDQLVEFARRGEAAGFASLGILDRLVYPGLDPLVTLAAAAAVTDRIALRTAVLLAPYRINAALLAKEAASVQVLSGGRLTLGLGLGWREEDYEASGIDYSSRGRRFDEMLAEIERVWSGHEYGFAGGIGPDVSDNPPQLLLGGTVDASFKRAARYGIGWIFGGGTPEQFAEYKQKLDQAWSEAGREGEPRGMTLGYFSLGEDAERNAQSYLGHYYGVLGEEAAKMAVANAAKDEGTIRGWVQAFSDVGCDELLLFPCSPDPKQADLLAAAAL